MKRLLMILTVFALLIPITGSAQIPRTLNYQGVLTDGSGDAVSDGSYDLAFALYNVPSGGTALWDETQPVTVSKGIFSAILGSVTPIDLDFDETYYLGISVEGGDELLPRIELTSSAYAMNSRGVTGDSNVFPPDGAVGIGIALPSYQLHVLSDGAVPARFDGNGTSWAGLYINALQETATPMVGYERQSTLKAYTYLDHNDNWACRVDGNPALTATADMRLGVGTSSPLEKLDVPGGVRIGNTATNNTGTIRWSGSDFEGYNGAEWKSLTGAGAEVLPSGTAGQTLRNTGSGWAAVSNLYNNGTDIGIGADAPTASLHVRGSGDRDIRVETTNAGESTVLELLTTDGVYDYLRFEKHGSSSGGSIDGIPLADLGIIYTGTMGGPMMIDVMTANPMYFMTSNVERMRIASDGSVGINTKTPGSTLHVNGTVSVGSDELTGNLELYNSSIATPVITMGSSTTGAAQYWMDENNVPMIGLYADPSSGGEGGYFYVKRTGAYSAFRVDGNYNDTESPRVSIFGASRSAVFDMTQAGNSSVSLPTDAVSSTEMFNEPGAASYTEGGGAGMVIGTSITVIGSRSITVPASGYVLVIAGGQATMNHVNGTDSYCAFGVSDNNTAFPENQDVMVGLNDTAPSGYHHMGTTVHGLFGVAGAGTYTYYFLGDETSGDFRLYDAQLTLLYIPTSYGTVSPTMMGLPQEETRGYGMPGLSESDISAERAESVAANIARIESELAAMRAELESLREEMEE